MITLHRRLFFILVSIVLAFVLMQSLSFDGKIQVQAATSSLLNAVQCP